MLDQNISTPLYMQLKKAITDEIQQKIYLPGERMPSELELEKKYKVSRITVRRAVKELCEEGILVRKQGKGTFVLDNPTVARLDHDNKGFHESLEKEGREVRVDILEKKIIHVKPSYARDLQIDEQDEVIYLRRLMYADGAPSMIDTAYIPAKRFPGLYDKLQGNVALFRMLREEYGVTLNKNQKVFRVLKVLKATKEMSRLLNCSVGDPMFDLFKITYNADDVPQLISVSILKGENTYYVISDDDGNAMNLDGISWKV